MIDLHYFKLFLFLLIFSIFSLFFFYFPLLRLNADAKVPNLKGITVEKIFGPSTPSVPSGGGEAVAAGGKKYGISRAANAFYAQTRSSTVLTRPEIKALGEILVNDRDPIVAMAPKGTDRFLLMIKKRKLRIGKCI